LKPDISLATKTGLFNLLPTAANISVNRRIGADPEPLMRTDLLRSAPLPALERFILLSDLFYGLEVAPVFEIGD
jgi:hypothetical protein